MVKDTKFICLVFEAYLKYQIDGKQTDDIKACDDVYTSDWSGIKT